MNITKIFADKANGAMDCKIPTIAFLGDSVTQGCFEVYMKAPDELETVFDKSCAYHRYLAKILEVLYPNVPVNIINAGISGDHAPHGYERLERDVLRYHPDLTVVCFGLNDCMREEETLSEYCRALSNIFEVLKAAGSEVIFMTANMMNTEISCHIQEPFIVNVARASMHKQLENSLEVYFEAAKRTAETCGVVVCDVYHKWKILEKNGVNTTNLLANYINHPSREMNWLFAYSLIETMMQEV